MLPLMISFVLFLVALRSSFAQDVYVSNTFTDADCTEAVRNCPNINSALNISSSFSTVFIYPGIYSGTGNANVCIGKCTDIKGVKITGLGEPNEIVWALKDVPFADSVAIFIFENTIASISNMTIQDFSNTVSNEANKAGAVEIVNSRVAIDNVVFRNNSGVIGGAMHITNSSITLNSTIFNDNSAKLHGGALFFVNSDAVLDRCVFVRNNVSTLSSDVAGTGGAIYFVGVDNILLNKCRFEQNNAERAGGALFMQLNSNTGNINVVIVA